MQGKSELPVLAIDLGGTKISAAVIAGDGRMVASEYRLTLAGEGRGAVVKRVYSAIDRLLNQDNIDLSQLGSISIGTAGAIDCERGLVTFSPHLLSSILRLARSARSC